MKSSLDHSPAQIISQLLKDKGFVTDPSQNQDWPIFVSTMPDGVGTPDKAVAIYDVTGIKETSIQRTGETLVHHGINIRARDIDYNSVWKKTKDLFDYLSGVKYIETVVGGISYMVIAFTHSSGIGFLGEVESRQRVSFVLNGTTTILRK